MLSGSASVWLGVIFVLIGAINVCLILQASARVRDSKASARLISAHRIGGYLFIAVFCTMGYFMVARMREAGSSAPSTTMIHVTLALVLSPLIFVKALIARYYKTWHSLLMPIGLMIFVLSFVLIGVTAGPALAHKKDMQTVSLAAIDMPPAAIDMKLAAGLMEKRCSRCHTLDRVAGSRKDARGWLSTVDRMRAFPDSGISEEDSRIIVSYLVSRMVPKGSSAATAMEVSRALVDQRCSRCHSLDRVYKTAKTPEEWSATVARMISFAGDSGNAFHPGEAEQIEAYLSATQTPAAVNSRSVQAGPRAAPGKVSVTQNATADTARPSQCDAGVIGFISMVSLVALTLIVRRPRRNVPAAAHSVATPVPPAPLAAPAPETLILRLASIVEQTHDAKTLRFVMHEGNNLRARPGQFLTFSLLFDGKKVSRSYSICSSPLRSGYIEITPKRVPQGCVSVFLNDRAAVGMTVEAKGAFGNFCFDEVKHDNVVMIAAGSGITPMMAMIRYIEDLCLGTRVTLLYCVRSADDIIFEAELLALRTRLKNFQYHILLSRPHKEWAGARGHVSREFIETTAENPCNSDFFLCGPPPFMETCRGILSDLGVKPERLLQESFGGLQSGGQLPDASSGETDSTVEFVRSSKSCGIRNGQTLLEAAEQQGVPIPSACRQGQCGTCRTRLISGVVQMDAEDGLDPDSKRQGFVLTCVGRAQGEVRLDA